MKFRTLALTAVTAGALGIAGCGDDSTSTGSGGGGDTKDANALLVNTFQPSGDSSKIKSGTIDIEIEGELTGGAISASGKASAIIKLNEAKDGQIPEFSAAVKVKGEQKGGGKVDLDAGGTYTDNRFYVSYDGDNYDVGEELSKRAVDSLKAAISQTSSDKAEQGDMIAKLGLEPQTWLTNPKVDGEEKVGDVDALKISGEVNVKALVPDILDAAKKAQSLAGSAGAAAKVPEVTDAQLDAAAKQIKKLDVAIWTGKDDNILRKLEVDLEVEGSKDDKVGGTVSLTLTDVNEEQDIKAPSDTKPITDLMPKLGGLFQQAAGLSAAGAGASGTGAVSQKYLDCMNAAGGDAAKLNACQAEAAK